MCDFDRNRQPADQALLIQISCPSSLNLDKAKHVTIWWCKEIANYRNVIPLNFEVEAIARCLSFRPDRQQLITSLLTAIESQELDSLGEKVKQYLADRLKREICGFSAGKSLIETFTDPSKYRPETSDYSYVHYPLTNSLVAKCPTASHNLSSKQSFVTHEHRVTYSNLARPHSRSGTYQ